MLLRLSTLWWRLLTENASPWAAEYALVLGLSVIAGISLIRRRLAIRLSYALAHAAVTAGRN